jgi:hypothetical protein
MVPNEIPCDEHCNGCVVSKHPYTAACLREKAKWCLQAARHREGVYRMSLERLCEVLMDEAQAIDRQNALLAEQGLAPLQLDQT